MLLLSALLALASISLDRIAPMPREARGWVTRHTFNHKAPVRAVTTTADGYVIGDKAGVLLMWDAKTGKLRETLLDGTNERAKPIDAVRLTPDGRRLDFVTRGDTGQIEMAGKDSVLHGPTDFAGPNLALAADGNWLTVRLDRDVPDPKTLHLLQRRFTANGFGGNRLHYFVHAADVRLAAGASRFVVSSDVTGTVHGWKPRKEQEVERAVWSVDLKKLDPTALAVSPNGEMVAVAGASGAVEVLDAKRGKPVAALKGHKGAVRAVAFTADSGLIATGGDDGTVRLWNPWTGEQEYLLAGHTAPVTAVWFAPDDALMTASDDKTARVWVYKP